MGLKIIGSGFGRTGPMSLKRALERLAFGPCHHMEELLVHPEQVHHWQQIATGRRMNWEEVFAGYDSQVDRLIKLTLLREGQRVDVDMPVNDIGPTQ